MSYSKQTLSSPLNQNFMHRTLLYLSTLLLFAASCKSKLTFIKGLSLGTPEAGWRKQIADLETNSILNREIFFDDTAFTYKWSLGDTSLNVKVRLNNDKIGTGDLRKLSLDLATAYTDTKSEFQGLGDRMPGTYTPFNGYYCTQRTYEQVRNHLEKSLGKPDSSSTFSWGYYKDSAVWYKTDDYDIELVKSPLDTTIQAVGVPLYNSAVINVYTKNYASEVANLEDAFRKNLKPSDLIDIGFLEPKLTKQRNTNGQILPALHILSWKEAALSHWLEKPVESVKGNLIIEDRFGEELYIWKDFEYKPNEPIRPSTVRELTYGKSWYLFMLNRPELERLKQAITLQRQLSLKFVPTDIYYADGTIFR
jgi:hypothetical protein